jgi:hypothetical protein
MCLFLKSFMNIDYRQEKPYMQQESIKLATDA